MLGFWLILFAFCQIDEGFWSRSRCSGTSGRNGLLLYIALSHMSFARCELFVCLVSILDPPEIPPVTSEG